MMVSYDISILLEDYIGYVEEVQVVVNSFKHTKNGYIVSYNYLDEDAKNKQTIMQISDIDLLSFIYSKISTK